MADILAVLYGGEEFIFKAIYDPEQLRKVLTKITRFYIEVMEFQLSLIPDFHGGTGSFYYYLWTPHDTVWHQEDSVMLLSPTIYDEVIKPFDEQIYTHFKHNICHFHSTGGFIPYQEVLSFHPLAIEMHLDSGGPSAEALFDRHREILHTTPLMIWGKFTQQDLDWVFSKLSPEGLALNIVVRSAEEAAKIWDAYILHPSHFPKR